MSEQRPLAIRRLQNVVERVAPRDPDRWDVRPALRRGRQASRGRAFQLWATVRQLALAVGHAEMPEGCGRSVQRLLGPEAVDAFLELASEGAFRAPNRPALLGRPLSWSSLATLRDCLKILGEEVGVAVVVPRVYRERMDLAPVAGEDQLDAVYGRLVQAPGDALMARSLAAAGLVLDSRMRSGDLVSRRVEHLHLDEATPWIEARWTSQGDGRVREDGAVLRPGVAVALRRWLRFRQQLVDGLQGSDHGMLWVTVRGSDRPDRRSYASGMPLHPWGFRYGFASGVGRLNETLAARWEGPGSWSPLPSRVEQWRRGAEWAQEQQPDG